MIEGSEEGHLVPEHKKAGAVTELLQLMNVRP